MAMRCESQRCPKRSCSLINANRSSAYPVIPSGTPRGILSHRYRRSFASTLFRKSVPIFIRNGVEVDMCPCSENVSVYSRVPSRRPSPRLSRRERRMLWREPVILGETIRLSRRERWGEGRRKKNAGGADFVHPSRVRLRRMTTRDDNHGTRTCIAVPWRIHPRNAEQRIEPQMETLKRGLNSSFQIGDS
jgi:hypothetical protein